MGQNDQSKTLKKIPSISFIVPVYNVEECLLYRCLTSIVRSATVLPDYEIIVVDDGSSSSSSVAHVVNRMENVPIRLVRNETNQGLSTSRNTAIELSEKGYLQFVDADDYLFSDAEQQLFDVCAWTRAEVVTFRMMPVSSEVSEEKIFDSIPTSQPGGIIVFEGTGADYAARHNLRAAACAYIFQKSVLKDNLRFTPDILREDEEFTTLLFLQAQHVAVTSLICYAYYQRSGSIMQNRSAEHVQRLLDDGMLTALKLSSLACRYQGVQSAMLRRKSALLACDLLFNMMQWQSVYADFKKSYLRMRDRNLFSIRLPKSTDVKHRMFHSLCSSVCGATMCWAIYRLCYFLRRRL